MLTSHEETIVLQAREIMRRALQVDACALILVHNHPSGDTTPSNSDLEMTRNIQDAAELLGITLHDHVIVGGHSPLSFRAQGLIT